MSSISGSHINNLIAMANGNTRVTAPKREYIEQRIAYDNRLKPQTNTETTAKQNTPVGTALQSEQQQQQQTPKHFYEINKPALNLSAADFSELQSENTASNTAASANNTATQKPVDMQLQNTANKLYNNVIKATNQPIINLVG